MLPTSLHYISSILVIFDLRSRLDWPACFASASLSTSYLTSFSLPIHTHHTWAGIVITFCSNRPADIPIYLQRKRCYLIAINFLNYVWANAALIRPYVGGGWCVASGLYEDQTIIIKEACTDRQTGTLIFQLIFIQLNSCNHHEPVANTQTERCYWLSCGWLDGRMANSGYGDRCWRFMPI